MNDGHLSPVILVFGASHSWSVVNSVVCSIETYFDYFKTLQKVKSQCNLLREWCESWSGYDLEDLEAKPWLTSGGTSANRRLTSWFISLIVAVPVMDWVNAFGKWISFFTPSTHLDICPFYLSSKATTSLMCPWTRCRSLCMTSRENTIMALYNE